MGGKLESIFTDHFPMEIQLKGLPRRKKLRVVEPAIWNINKPGGWAVYKDLTNSVAEKLDEIIDTETLTITEMAKKVETIENKVRFMAFGKTRTATKKKVMMDDKTTNVEEKDSELLKRQSAKIEEQINDINRKN